ncbi:hypothetical protein NDU88_002589 [Pleurodeles waltl]|uniref:Uncharacterized protein n=1 Tax=Pleurodeles waltl TaxID=8319 RepID=A0AAV7KSL6_PLEWA|nr:hypothetical protein NDU88_002589 [Pleurodeles waltl]
MYSLPRRKSPLMLRRRKLLIGLLVERQSRTGPLRPHTSSAVRAGGTSLQRECFTSLPGWQQAAAPQSSWGPAGEAPRVAQGEPSEFGPSAPLSQDGCRAPAGSMSRRAHTARGEHIMRLEQSAPHSDPGDTLGGSPRVVGQAAARREGGGSLESG